MVAAMFLCIIAIAGVAVLYPFVFSAISGPAYSITVLFASLINNVHNAAVLNFGGLEG
jgi:hypothetical protein